MLRCTDPESVGFSALSWRREDLRETSRGHRETQKHLLTFPYCTTIASAGHLCPLEVKQRLISWRSRQAKHKSSWNQWRSVDVNASVWFPPAAVYLLPSPPATRGLTESRQTLWTIGRPNKITAVNVFVRHQLIVLQSYCTLIFNVQVLLHPLDDIRAWNTRAWDRFTFIRFTFADLLQLWASCVSQEIAQVMMPHCSGMFV